MYKQAVIIGKFLPLHKGHIFLVQSAIQRSENVTVLVCTLEKQPIPGKLRYQWMKQTFKDRIDARHIDEDLPQYPNQHPNFWEIWCNVIKNNTPKNLDVIFSSETYGKTLAQKMNIAYYDVDIERKKVPICATLIRQKPFTHWNMISDAAKPYFVKKIVVVGPQSVGKSTMVEYLAKHYNTQFSHQYGREYNQIKRDLDVSDFQTIARGHVQLQKKKAMTANKLLFVDTECIVTKIFLDLYFPKQAHKLQDFFNKWIQQNCRNYELYILIKPQGQGVNDGLRQHLHVRNQHFQMLKEHLIKHKVPFVVLDDGFQQNIKLAIKEVDKVIAKY